MRDLDPALEEGTEAHIPEVAYLVEILLDTPLRLTTSAALDWNGYTWSPAGLTIPQMEETAARIELDNSGNVGSALVLNNTLRDVECRIYVHYNGSAIEIFRGYGSDASGDRMRVSLDLVADKASLGLVPNDRIAAPVFTNLPRFGEVIRWGGEHFKVTF